MTKALRLVLIVGLMGSSALGDKPSPPADRHVIDRNKGRRVNVWELTRQADVVVVADVTSVETTVTAAISEVLKGQTDHAAITFPAPPQPVPRPKEIRCPPPRSWNFAVGQQWVLFCKTTAGDYNFVDGRTGDLSGTIVAVRQFLDVEALTSEVDKVRQLVRIVADYQGLSASSAFCVLQTLNKPEYLDLLAPLAEYEACKQAYISLLRGNQNPKTVDLLRAMLQRENGENLREAMDAIGRKDGQNEAISRELLPFLDHTNAVIRSASVFILNCRDYRSGFPRIVRALDDPDPAVRASALAWPWYAYVNDHPEVKAKIKKLRKDADANVREAAKRALAGMSTWYRLWYFHR